MINEKLFSITMILYILAFMSYMLWLAFKNQKVSRKLGYIATSIASLGLLVHTVGFFYRWYESYQIGAGHAPLTNMFESMVFFTWAIMALYLIIEWKYQLRAIGIVSSFLAGFGLAVTSLLNLPKEINPLVPALQSHWLQAHVITCFLGYAAFAIAFGVSGLFLIQRYMKSRGKNYHMLPAGHILDELNYKAIAIGFPMLTIGIFTGAVWAEYAWGSYWSWDPKETWSLVTWFVYAIFLHFRLTRGWRGTRSAVLSMIGFAFVIFTYWGVNYLLSGLHSYA